MILDAAVQMARCEGLDSLSIGKLAKKVKLSKSGLFAHFNSKETLQVRVLEWGVQEFVSEVLRPALRHPRGEQRLRAIFNRWLRWAGSEADGGCLFLGAAQEYDDRPGSVREFLVDSQHQWVATLGRAIQDAKDRQQLSETAEVEQLGFEIYGIMMAYHLYHRLLDDEAADKRTQTAFERLLDGYR